MLLERNPENSGYYTGLEQCTQVDSIEERLKTYTDVLDMHPRATAPKKLPLAFVTGGLICSRNPVLIGYKILMDTGSGIQIFFVKCCWHSQPKTYDWSMFGENLLW